MMTILMCKNPFSRFNLRLSIFELKNKNVEDVALSLVDTLSKYFGVKASSYEIKDIYSIPFNTATISFTLYNYLVARVLLESDSIYFYIVSADRLLEIFENPVDLEQMNRILPLFDEKIQLRIPDKFLMAAAWITSNIKSLNYKE